MVLDSILYVGLHTSESELVAALRGGSPEAS